MFDKWLLFFYSRKNNINNKLIKKKWLDGGEMEISGNDPKEWSIVIKPEISINIYTYLYEYENKKKESINLMKENLLSKNKKEFDESIKSYENYVSEIKKIENIIMNNAKKIEDIDNKIFEIKKDIFHQNDKVKLKLLNDKLEKIINDKINISDNIKKNEENYTLSNKSLVKKGPVPNVPTIKSDTYKFIRKKFEFDKSNTNNSMTSLSENKYTESNTKINTQKQDGGFIKVIKLL